MAQTDGRVAVRLSPEPGIPFPVEVFVGNLSGYVGPGRLGLSRQLERDLIGWLRWWQQHVSPGGDEVVDGDDAEWRRGGEQGERLSRLLQQQLGQDFIVGAS